MIPFVLMRVAPATFGSVLDTAAIRPPSITT
jgi:hypothetical protein